MTLHFTPTSEQAMEKLRLDTYLAGFLTAQSRSHLQNRIRSGEITVNGRKVKAGYVLAPGDEIAVPEEETVPVEIDPEEIPLEIVYEDEDVIVVNKPKGMVVHPAAGHSSGTLVNALMAHCRDSLSGINGELRPGIVHRIDMDTTGLIIACKNDTAHQAIAAQLEEHSITRKYIALCWGNFREDSGTVDLPIDRSRQDRKKMAVCGIGEGKTAVTHWRVLERFPLDCTKKIGAKQPLTLVECVLETGRTHQIRVHLSHEKHPLAGDEVYGIQKDPLAGQGQYLHAAVLGFTHPKTGERLTFETPLPEYFRSTLKKLKY